VARSLLSEIQLRSRLHLDLLLRDQRRSLWKHNHQAERLSERPAGDLSGVSTVATSSFVTYRLLGPTRKTRAASQAMMATMRVVTSVFAAALPLCTMAFNNGAPFSRLPPMGWSSWDALGPGADHPVRDFCDTVSVKAAADAYIESGLFDAGYVNALSLHHSVHCWKQQTLQVSRSGRSVIRS
jgi:hypothetical protein